MASTDSESVAVSEDIAELKRYIGVWCLNCLSAGVSITQTDDWRGLKWA